MGGAAQVLQRGWTTIKGGAGGPGLEATRESLIVNAAQGNNGVDYIFRATGSVEKFEGFLKIYKEGTDQTEEDDEEKRLPAVSEGEHLRFREIKPD